MFKLPRDSSDTELDPFGELPPSQSWDLEDTYSVLSSAEGGG